MSTMSRTAISGFHNYSEGQQHLFGHWKEQLSKIYSSHGFVPFHPRPAEPAGILKKTGGLSHEVYRIARMTDSQITDLALPYDRTVPLALWVHQHATSIVFPFKRQNIDISWRAERAQAGRFRAFYQADIDMIGPNLGHMADVECISTLYEGLQSLGFTDFHMCINHIAISKAIIKTLGFSEEKTKEALRIIDKLDKLTKDEIVNQILFLDKNLSISDVHSLVDIFSYRGSLEGFDTLLNEEALDAYIVLKEVFNNLETLGVDLSRINFCPGMVRGLDYYTGIVFETFLDGDGKKFGSIASGGRFDKLVSGLDETSRSRRELPGVGGSIGLTRLFDIYQKTIAPSDENMIFRKKSDADCAVIFHTEEEKKTAMMLAKRLRELGKKVDFYTEGSTVKMSNKLDYVDKKGIPNAILVFSDDICIKTMSSGEQIKFTTLDEVVDHLGQKK